MSSSFIPGAIRHPWVQGNPAQLRHLTFDASGRFLVAAGKIFTSNDDAIDLGIEGDLHYAAPSEPRIVAHPTLPKVAVMLSNGVVIVDLVSRETTRLAIAEPSVVAFDHDGRRLAIATSDATIRVFGLDGKERRAMTLPPEKMTANPPAVTFARGADALVVYPEHNTRVVLPLDGSAPKVSELPKVKPTSAFAHPKVLSTPSGDFLFDGSGYRLVDADGKVAWAGRGNHEAAALVPNGRALAIVKLQKKLVSFVSTKTGDELGTVKIKIKWAPLGFSCARGMFAWADDGAIQLVAIPAGVGDV